jgi:Zn-dependent M28 family amino/carboxypeptidase
MSLENRLQAHLHALTGERHPFSCPEKLQQAERYLSEQFSSLCLNVETHAVEAFGGTYRNVIGTLRGRRDAPSLIVAAHYDTVEGSPGADDNASGLVVLLDVARRLSDATLDRSVRFIAFCLEEQNLLGSLAYAAHLKATGEEILGAIVLECVGYARLDEGSQRKPPGVSIPIPSIGNFLAVVGNAGSAELTATIEQVAKLHLPVASLVVPGNGELLPDVRRSDHAAFWHYGYPAVMLTDTANFRNPHYHQPTDALGTLDLDFMTSVTDAVTAAVLHLTGSQRAS